MEWLVLAYSLPSKGGSTTRVAIWRRLRRIGAVSPVGAVYVLPAHEECGESLQWLAQEIRQAQGEAVVMRVDQFEGLTDQHLVELFRTARSEEYADLATQTAALEQALQKTALDEREHLRDTLTKLRRRHMEIARIDYFDTPSGAEVAAHLDGLQHALVTPVAPAVPTSSAVFAAYRGKQWVTRPRPHVDRLACVWLIRRFIDADAVIRYAATPEPDDITFDMSDAHFGHQGNLCTFETMLRAFALDDPALHVMAEIVHEIDLRDGQYHQPETDGIDAILKGWLISDLSDAEREARGVALFEGLYTSVRTRPAIRAEEHMPGA